MLNITIILILLINSIYQINTNKQCNFLNSIDLQLATYSHSVILRVQSFNLSEEIENNFIIRKVFVHEIIKIPKFSNYQIQIYDMIIIRIDKNLNEILDHSCWYLLRITTIDIIIFLNETNANEFILRYPPVESTFRIRQNINAVINYETYSPQVIIKTRITKPILFNNYSLQCNARGNPLPRLEWSKNNQTLEYYPSARQCKTSCRIYSIQNKYKSILYFQSLIPTDSGIYVCHAENGINHTMASVYIGIDQMNMNMNMNMNMTCANLRFCHNRGQCIYIDNQLKCLCDNRYFGEQCETNYDEIIKKQNNIILLFKSRFLIGCILFLIGFICIFLIFISCLLTRNNQTKRKLISTSKTISNGNIEHFLSHSSSPIRVITKESTTTPPDNVDQYQISTKLNKSKELNLESKTNHLILSKDYLKFYQPNAEVGLIRPLNLQTDTSKRILFHNRFLSPRSVNQS